MKNFLFIAAMCFFFNTMSFEQRAFAKINDQQLQEYISSFGWTMEDLQQYLANHDRTLADFATFDKLKQWLGTPITEENINELLTRYRLTQEELEALLGQFGETTQDYTFINDLDTAVDFYLHHNEQMQKINDMLASIGFTEGEASRLFEHIMSLHDKTIAQRLEALDARIERLLHMDERMKFTTAQQKEALSIWQDLLATLGLQSKFYLVKIGQMEEVSARQLIAMETLEGRDLLVALDNHQGERVMDLQLPENMFMSKFVLHAGQDFIHAGQMASEMKEKMQGEKMPNTASPYVMNVLMGLFLMLLGAFLYLQTRKKAVE